MNLGAGRGQLHRARCSARPGALRPDPRADAQFGDTDAHPIRHNTQVSFHTGAAETRLELR